MLICGLQEVKQLGIFNTPFSNAWSIKCEGVTIAVISTVNCDGVTMYHLSVGISKIYWLKVKYLGWKSIFEKT